MVAAVIATVTISVYQYQRVWSPAKRIYFPVYMHTLVAPRKDAVYEFLTVVDGKKARFFLADGVVEPAVTANGQPTWALTAEAVRRGAARLEFHRARYDSAILQHQLHHLVYQDESLLDMVRPSLWGGAIVLLAGIILAIPAERKRTRLWKHGKCLKGPELVTVSEFNERNTPDGIGFLNDKRNKLRSRPGKNGLLRVPKKEEPNHFLILGDTGSGKSSLIRQILEQGSSERNTSAHCLKIASGT
jgi:hypothetical protein